MRCAGEALADSMFRVNPPTRTVRVFKPTVPEGWFVKEFGDVNWHVNAEHDEDEVTQLSFQNGEGGAQTTCLSSWSS